MSRTCDPNRLARELIEKHKITYGDFDDPEADPRINFFIREALRELTPEDLGRLICLLEGKIDVIECASNAMAHHPRNFRDLLEEFATFGINMIIFSTLRSTEN